MRCPICKTRHLKVLDTRPNPEFIARKRQCENGHKFQTEEYAIPETPIHKKPETIETGGGSFLSKLWHGQWRAGGSQ